MKTKRRRARRELYMEERGTRTRDYRMTKPTKGMRGDRAAGAGADDGELS